MTNIFNLQRTVLKHVDYQIKVLLQVNTPNIDTHRKLLKKPVNNILKDSLNVSGVFYL